MKLIRAALTKEPVQEKPNAVSWENVYRLAVKQNVEGISYYGLSNLKQLPPDALYKKWEEARDRTTFRVLRFDIEREQILEEMRAQGLSFLPLKGILAATYYPEPGMRSMADNDILYGIVEANPEGGFRVAGASEQEQERTVQKAQNILVSIMQGRGFEVGNLNGNHDNYYREPMYNFEMHRRLVHTSVPHWEYYKNPWLRAVQDEKDPYAFHFSAEDEYIYLLVHAHKHFSAGGCGVRHLNDIYTFLKAKRAELNWNYVDAELEKLELTGFEKDFRILTENLFEMNEPLTKCDEELLYFLLGCGVYGRSDVRVMHRLAKFSNGKEIGLRARIRYIWNRIFLDKETVKDAFPFFADKPYLMPFLAVYRTFKGWQRNPAGILNEWKTLWKKK